MVNHPDESGLRLISDDIDAFAVRAHAARSAGRSLDLATTGAMISPAGFSAGRFLPPPIAE